MGVGRHSPEAAPGTDAQRDRTRNGGQFSPDGPSWNTVTARFFTSNNRSRQPIEEGRHRVPPPAELLQAGLHAVTAATDTTKEELTKYLRQQHEQLPEIPKLTELMELTAAHFVRLGINSRERGVLLSGLAQTPKHITGFYSAFSGAETIGIAVSRLPWEETTLRRSP